MSAVGSSNPTCQKGDVERGANPRKNDAIHCGMSSGKPNLSHSFCNRFVYRRGYRAIVMASLVVFATLAAVGLVLVMESFEAQENEAYHLASKFAEESANKLSSQLEQAIVPLFSMAQFATELQIFKNLPDTIGQAIANGSLPLLTQHGKLSPYRNVTGICGDPELVVHYNRIVATIKKNLKMEDILYNIQLVPYGVICLSAGAIDLSGVIGLDILQDPKYMDGARATMQQDNLGLVGPLLLDTPSVDNNELFFVARLPVRSETDRIVSNGVEYDQKYGVVSALLSWEGLLRVSNIHEDMRNHGYEFQLIRTDRVYNAKDWVYNEGSVVLTESVGFNQSMDSNKSELSVAIQSLNDRWVIVLHYDSDAGNKFLLAIVILASFFFAALIFIVLAQKQFQATLLGNSMAQEAKVDVERNMTAYFAHELRNPLGAIDSALESMPEGLPMEANELIKGMRLCSAFMSCIMNNLLDVRKIEEGKMILRADPLSLASLLEDVRRMSLPSVKPGVELKVLIETKDRDCVLGDEHRMKQVLTNILSNSIKYTTRGSITLYAGWKGDAVRLECGDTGPGIPKAEQEKLFDRFVMRGGAPGSGLGLAISKQIVELMNGSIHFESDPRTKAGTTCVVLLPLKPTSDVLSPLSQQHVDYPIESTFTILIIDDIKMNRDLFQKRIHKSIAPNSKISEAPTGEKGLVMTDTGTYDIIIVDQYMEAAGGVLVGTDVIAAMRRTGMDSFIIGCSGNDMQESFLEAGADVVWGKPLPSNQEILRQFRLALEMRRRLGESKYMGGHAPC